MPKTVTYTTGTQNLSTLNLPSDVIIRLAGTDPSSAPYVTANANLAPPFNPVTVGKVEVLGRLDAPSYGSVEPIETPFVIQDGVQVKHGTLVTDTNIGMTVNGDSEVTDGGTLNVLGGRYFGSTFTLSGTLSVGKDSTANFSSAHLFGNGTVETTSDSATIDARFVGGAFGSTNDVGHFDLTKGGTLNLFEGDSPSMFFIDMGNKATVNVNTSVVGTAATSEVWHSVSDVLDLFNAAGANVGELDFTKGTPELYAAPTTDHMPAPFNYAANSVQITTHHAANDLPVTVVHS